MDIVNPYTINALRESLGLSLCESLELLTSIGEDAWISYQHSLPGPEISRSVIEVYYNKLVALHKLQTYLESSIELVAIDYIPVFESIIAFKDRFPASTLLSFRIYNAAAMHVYLRGLPVNGLPLKPFRSGDYGLVENLPDFEAYIAEFPNHPPTVN